ncbi:hypothetical protein [Mesorhizobium sp. ES1-1]|uniref:hypothetical protein n=1 Tax=Mesorhizobium sp. ES1-1 TaxID=2876629 RepID=UPI001CC9A8D2|nr:hypothetical protein [Mesorhizobium sp. ES1-1]MBZ9677383.1 hypothetical protein [Mesorhizobium sp. ES1-1]
MKRAKFLDGIEVLRGGTENQKEPTRASLVGMQSLFCKLGWPGKNIPYVRFPPIGATAAGLEFPIFWRLQKKSQNSFF